MKSLQFFINEKLQINKDTKIKFTLDDSIKDHIIEIIYTFCQLFKGVNKLLKQELLIILIHKKLLSL